MSRRETTSSPLNEGIGRRIRELRQRAGLTTQDVERLTDGRVRAGHLSNLERDLQMWQAHHLEAVALALGAEPRDLMPAGVAERANEGEGLTEHELELILAFRSRDWPRVFRALAMLADVRNGDAGA